jgi:hypothetical protein
MRVRKITAVLNTDDEVGEAFRLVGLRAITLPWTDGYGVVWLCGRTVDSEREIRVRLDSQLSPNAVKETVFVADFGPVGSYVFAVAVLGRLLPASLGEQTYIHEVLERPGDELAKMVSASQLATYRTSSGADCPKYDIELVR